MALMRSYIIDYPGYYDSAGVIVNVKFCKFCNGNIWWTFNFSKVEEKDIEVLIEE